ncbi:ArnT family glycosyltransferase [Planctomicrobium sp. SH664]|uniref:ArnT family glycosyltransferase n=1 Tax=Planctomicrobium sp. SH664 TaxID=3448125 RepID=UPI003F5BA1A6
MPAGTFCRTSCFLPLLLALLGMFSVAATIDLAKDCRWSAEGPGLTFDEGFNVDIGVYLVESMIHAGLGLLHPATLAEIYNDPAYNPDHPPLGRLAMGISNALLCRLGDDPRISVVTYARVASALEYGALIWLVTRFCLRRCGRTGAVAAGLSLLLTPRLWAHAHLAALETCMNLTYALFVLVTLDLWSRIGRTPVQTTVGAKGSPQGLPHVLRPRDGIVPGILLGLALLTKMQAIFLPPVFVVWALLTWRSKALLPIVVTAVVSFLVFFAGWPWLWHDPVNRMLDYFARSTDRITLYCYYWGERFADREVPWHFPWITFLITTPVVCLLPGLLGLWPERAATSTPRLSLQRHERLFLLAAMLLPLGVFSLPGVTVYDGERLYLVAWPLFAVFVGIGAQRIASWLVPVTGESHVVGPGTKWKWGTAAVVLFLLLFFPLRQMILLQPCQLSYYNELVGGLAGADRLGFEPTYWGDAVTSSFLKRSSQHLPQQSRLAVAPLLHPAYLQVLRRDSWLRHRPDLTFEPYDDTNPQLSKYVLVIRRHADPWASLTPPPPGTRVLEQVTRDGVVLAELLQLP